jgi:plastocyanin
MNRRFKLAVAVKLSILALLALFLAPQGHAASYDIYMTEYGFDPAYLEVQVGDTVTWWNDDSWGDPHTTRSYSYPWSSGLVQFGYGVYLTVTRTGTFDYIDEMTAETGTLVVNPSTPPQPTPSTLSDPKRLPDGRFEFTLNNLTPGTTYIIQASTNVIEASTNLVVWTNLSTNVAANSIETYTDEGAAAFRRRFYRAWHLP